MLSAFPANTFTRKMEIYSKMYFVPLNMSSWVFPFENKCSSKKKEDAQRGKFVRWTDY